MLSQTVDFEHEGEQKTDSRTEAVQRMGPQSHNPAQLPPHYEFTDEETEVIM